MSMTDQKNSWKDIFSERLRQAIAEKGMNAETLSKEMGKLEYPISAKMIRDYINQVSVPSADRLLWFSSFFGKPMDWFFGREVQQAHPCKCEEEHAFIPIYRVEVAAGLSGIVAGDYPEVESLLPLGGNGSERKR